MSEESEEINIVELFKLIQEGKAPKKIKILEYEFTYDDEETCLDSVYKRFEICRPIEFWFDLPISIDTKIKILDKPVIEEIEIYQDDDGNDKAVVYPLNDGTNNKNKNYAISIVYIANKINEIIRFINNNEIGEISNE